MTASDDYADWEYDREKADYINGPDEDLDDEDDPDELDS